MIEKKFIQMKKDEFALKEFIKNELGKGKISSVAIERTPVGEKISIRTSKPGIIIGRRGEKIADLTNILKKEFKMENPHIEIIEIKDPALDPWAVGDEIALALERFGPIGFKTAAYRMLDRIKRAGALGAEIRLGGKLPGEKARSWPFRFGLLKKTGDMAKAVDRARIVAKTRPGVVGIKVEILSPESNVSDRIEVDKNRIGEIKVQEPQEQNKENKDKKTQKEAGKNEVKEKAKKGRKSKK